MCFCVSPAATQAEGRCQAEEAEPGLGNAAGPYLGVDVWTCRCGGKRKVLAVVTSRRAAVKVLRNMGLLQPPSPVPVAQSPPQLELAV